MSSFNTIILSLLAGLVPALLWLWFWLKEDSAHPEPKRRIILSFLFGMISVLLVLPIEKGVLVFLGSGLGLFTLISWAFAEEILKYLAAYFSSIKNNAEYDEPIDSVIYMISAALGFSALENSLFLANLIASNAVTQSIISGSMRFIGATLLHVSSSATIGVFMALSFYRNKELKKAYLLIGIIASVVLHTLFNSLIMKLGSNVFFVFSGVWVSVIILLLVIEKVKTISYRKDTIEKI